MIVSDKIVLDLTEVIAAEGAPIHFKKECVLPCFFCQFAVHYYTDTQQLVFERIMTMAERNLVNLTVTMTKEERKALKQIALDKDMTVSALLREWLKEHQMKEARK